MSMSEKELINTIVRAYISKKKQSTNDPDLIEHDKELEIHKKPKFLPPRKDKHKNRIKEKDEQKNKDQYEKYHERYDY